MTYKNTVIWQQYTVMWYLFTSDNYNRKDCDTSRHVLFDFIVLLFARIKHFLFRF